MKTSVYAITIALLLVTVSCGGNSSRSVQNSTDIDFEQDYGNSGIVADDEATCGCRMCGMSGMITDFTSGAVVQCIACNGTGYVSAELDRQLRESEEMGRKIASEVYGGPDAGNVMQGESGYDSGFYGGGNQFEIEQCQREIENLQRGLSMIDEGSSLYIFYRQELTALEYKLKQLQNQ